MRRSFSASSKSTAWLRSSTVRHASDFGVMTSEPTIDWGAAKARKSQTVENLVRGLGGLLKQRKVEVVIGGGRLAFIG